MALNFCSHTFMIQLRLIVIQRRRFRLMLKTRLWPSFQQYNLWYNEHSLRWGTLRWSVRGMRSRDVCVGPTDLHNTWTAHSHSFVKPTSAILNHVTTSHRTVKVYPTRNRSGKNITTTRCTTRFFVCWRMLCGTILRAISMCPSIECLLFYLLKLNNMQTVHRDQIYLM